MPIYDFRCGHCAGIFEALLPVSRLRQPIDCRCCGRSTVAEPMLTGCKVALQSVQSWRPRSKAEELCGAGAAGPGSTGQARRSSVLHTCGGGRCSLCGT